MKEETNIEPEINKSGKNNPFSVPDGYFESFPGKLRHRLQTEEQLSISFTERAWQILRPQFALAAAITGFAIIGYLGLRTFIQSDQEWLSDENIAEYIDYYQHEFNEYQILSLFENGDIYPDEDLFFDEPDLYMDYLYMENIDIDLILDEF